MDNGARHWLLRTAKLNLWRVATFYDLSDLIQDGCLVWCKVTSKYERQAGTTLKRAHLMALFKRSYMNHLHDLANERTKLQEVLVSDLIAGSSMISEYDIWDRYVKAPADELDHALLLVEMDPVAKQAILMMESDEGARLLRLPARKRIKPRLPETDEDRVRQMMGVADDAPAVLPQVKSALLSA
jgi:hypothetical protein